MHPSPSLVSGSIEDAIAALAERSVAMTYCSPRLPRQMLEKTAFLQEAGKNIGAWWKGLNPTAQKAMMGAGIGGALGIGSSLMKDEEERNIGGSALTGALAGGALGAGIGLAGQHQPGVPKDPSALREGQFRHGGKVYEWGKDMTPEAAARIAELQGQAGSTGWGERVGEGIYEGGKTLLTSPETLAMGGAGAGLAGLKGAAGTQKGSWLQRVISPFSEDTAAKASRNPKHISKGATKLIEDKNLLERFGITGKNDIIEDQVTRESTRGAGQGIHSKTTTTPKVLSTSFDHSPELTRLLNDDAFVERLARGDSSALNALPGSNKQGLLAKLKEMGVMSEMGENWSKKNPGGIPTVRKSLLGSIGEMLGTKALGPTHIANNRLARVRSLGKFGLPVLGAGLMANSFKNNFNRDVASDSMDELVRRYAKPVE